MGALPLMVALAAAPAKPAIRLTPVPPPASGQFGVLAFRMAAPWMKGSIQLRMPETLQSSQGLHFIDHDRADMPPLSRLEPFPRWTSDPSTGALSYDVSTKEGVRMRATARPAAEQVDVELAVTNNTGKELRSLNCQMCLVLTEEPQFGKRLDLAPVHTWIGGRFVGFDHTTPTPADKRREPWVLMLTRAGAPGYRGAREWPDGWWVVDQLADLPVIARVAADGKHLVAIQWGPEQTMLMTNTRIPCLHAGPNVAVDVAPGATHTWRGVIYLMPNRPEKLVDQVRASAR